jgi:hypothetical protein
VRTGRELGRCPGHANQVFSAVFAPDGRTILSGAGNDMRLWQVPK